MDTTQTTTTLKDHESRDHAILSPSSAHRWLLCTPSARMEEQYPDTTSQAATEGTIAHEVAEVYAFARLSDEDEPVEELVKSYVDRFAKEHDLTDYDAKEMIRHAKQYADLAHCIREDLQAHSDTGAYALTEVTTELTDYIPEGFGSVDFLCYSSETLAIMDYKYGRGVKVSAVGNPQMMIYALGALSYIKAIMGKSPKYVSMTIFQPRLDHEDTHVLSSEELEQWGDETLKPLAKRAFAGEGDLFPGDHCRFCRAKVDCPARKKQVYDLRDFALSHTEHKRLTDEELAGVLDQAELVRDYLKAAEDEAYARIGDGAILPRWKVVPGRSVRKVTDEGAMCERLKMNGFKEADFLESRLFSIGKLEKLVGKKAFTADYSDLVEKPEGKPTLVPDSDPRGEKGTYDKEDFALSVKA